MVLVSTSCSALEAGNELVLTLSELPAKMKNPTWTLTGMFVDPETGDVLDEDVLESSQLPTLQAGTWTASVVPSKAGTLTIQVGFVDGKNQDMGTAVVTVERAPTWEEELERALGKSDLKTVMSLLSPNQGKENTETENDDPAAMDLAPSPAPAIVPAPAASQRADEAADEGSSPFEREGYTWEHSETGIPLIDLLAKVKASEEEKLEVLNLMLFRGATLPVKPLHRSAPPSALHSSLALKEQQMVEAILPLCTPEHLRAQCLSPISKRFGFTPLHIACEVGNTAAIAMLISKGVPLDGPLGTPTPVSLCIERGDVHNVKVLVRHGGPGLLRLGTQDVGFSALALASRAADLKPPSIEPDELVNYLLAQPVALSALAYSVSPKDVMAEAMSTACAYGLHHVVCALLWRGVSPAPLHPDGRVSLLDAVEGGHVKTVQLLLASKVDPNVRIDHQAPGKQLALCIAASLPDLPTARLMTWLLRSKGADVQRTEVDGTTTPLGLVMSTRPEATALIADLQEPVREFPLPVGWSKAYDSKLLRSYYYHGKTRTSRWEPPLPDGVFG